MGREGPVRDVFWSFRGCRCLGLASFSAGEGVWFAPVLRPYDEEGPTCSTSQLVTCTMRLHYVCVWPKPTDQRSPEFMLAKPSGAVPWVGPPGQTWATLCGRFFNGSAWKRKNKKEERLGLSLAKHLQVVYISTTTTSTHKWVAADDAE